MRIDVNRFEYETRSPLAAMILGAAVLLSGCVANHYEVVMTPDGETLHRELTTWRSSTGKDGEQLTTADQSELDRLARLYDTDVPTAAEQKYRFAGSFPGATPDDVGGSGSLTVWTSRLGRTSLYIERYRGSNDLNASLRKRHDAADELVDALTVWFEEELGATDDGAAINRFLQDRFREDLKNLATWLWVARATADAGQSDDAEPQTIAGVLQFATERGYITPEDLPDIMRIRSGTDPAILLSLLRRMVAKQAGIDEASLGFLSDPNRLQESINTHLASLPAAKSYLQEADDQSKKPTDYLTSLVIRTIAPALFAGGDQVDVTLRCPVKPFRTNGSWSDEESSITWSEQIAPRGDEPHRVLPALLFAAWSEPDETFQREHFGSVILTGEPLGEYCLWRNSLNEQQAGEWDAFVQSLRPEADLADLTKRIGSFRFSSDPPPEASETTAAQQGRDLLLTFLAGSMVDEDE
ncbi:MAG: hypothetical protein ACF8PG_09180 [Maioricimonas sp. JB045]